MRRLRLEMHVRLLLVGVRLWRGGHVRIGVGRCGGGMGALVAVLLMLILMRLLRRLQLLRLELMLRLQ